MELQSRYGNGVTPLISIFDPKSGEIVGALCKRDDGAKRYYRIMDLRHPNGIHGVMVTLESAPAKLAQDDPQWTNAL